MDILQVVLAVVLIIILIRTKKKWVVLLGWVLVFIAGSFLYCIVYSAEIGRVDIGVFMSAIMSSIRNFFINNDFASYADKTDSVTFLALNIVSLLSVFMTLLTVTKIMLAYFADRLHLLLYGKHKHICIFTDNSTASICLARSVKDSVNNSLCIFVGCDRIAEFETEKDVLFLETSAYAQLKNYESEVFICSQDATENINAFKRLNIQLSQSKFYLFAENDTFSLNKEELLVRYLFISNRFIPKSFSGNEQMKLCIVGDNNLAVELCKELIVQCQSIKGLPQITVIGASAQDNFAFFVKSNPGLGNCVEFFFINENPNSVAGISALTYGEYHLCFFCDHNKKLSKLIAPEKIIEMPDYEVIYDYNVIVNLSLDKEARELNAEYVRSCQTENSSATVDADAEWQKLTEFQRQSNRSQATNILSKRYLRSIGVTLEQLAAEEHLRWNAFHYVNGWIYGKTSDNKKDVQKKMHPCLVPYDRLPQAEKIKDMMFIEKIFREEEKE